MLAVAAVAQPSLVDNGDGTWTFSMVLSSEQVQRMNLSHEYMRREYPDAQSKTLIDRLGELVLGWISERYLEAKRFVDRSMVKSDSQYLDEIRALPVR